MLVGCSGSQIFLSLEKCNEMRVWMTASQEQPRSSSFLLHPLHLSVVPLASMSCQLAKPDRKQREWKDTLRVH